ncbi:hypothetical protein BP422_14710 [Brevibacillus formosus]|uniref:Uncharacterized protein n=1 Tax=Brevibacillus formosus TaxID=54913 RepID=A0A220MIB4_9BACL|nr:hypothetical protein [Brevibacillus formosus]ASJ54713.1 hypothetical protein BP422_14710 [Brevibacillus formosus]
MKKYMTKPVLAVVTAAGILGCLTPIFANASSIASPSATKVVMNDEGKQVTRYNLKELAQNDPTTLNMLLKNQADHLYIIVDEINLNKKLQTFMEENKAEWERIYNEYYSDIWLEVRLTENAEEIVSVNAKTENNKVYIKGIVTSDVTKVVVKKPNSDIIEVVPTNEHSFTVSFEAPDTSYEPYVTVSAYEGSKLVDTEKVKIVPKAEEDKEMIIHTMSVLDAKKKELKVKGIVKQGADKVTVTYNGVKKDANVKKLWDGVGSFAVSVKDVQAAKDQKALIEVYEDGKKVDSESIQVEIVNAPDKDQATVYAIKATAVNNPATKSIQVKGTVSGWNEKDDTELFVIAPDGNKKEIEPNDKGEFSLTLSYKNRSFSAKSIQFALYEDDKLVKKADVALSTKVIVEPVKPTDDDEDDDGDKKKKEKGKQKDKHPNGNAYGYWKKHGKEWNDNQDDDHDDEDDRDEDRD